MRKQIIFTLIVSLLSFGMIDSAVGDRTPEKTFEQLVQEEELKKLE